MSTDTLDTLTDAQLNERFADTFARAAVITLLRAKEGQTP